MGSKDLASACVARMARRLPRQMYAVAWKLSGGEM